MKFKYQTSITYILLLFPLVTNAQIDSLLSVLKNTSNNSTKVTLYQELADQTEAFEQALVYANKALAISKKLKNDRLMASSYYTVGKVYFYNSEYSEMFPFFEKSYILYLDLKDTKEIAETAYYLGISYDLISEYEKAIEYFLIALDWDKQQNYIYGIDNNYYRLAYVYSELDDFETALEYANLCYELEKENNLDVSYGQDALSNIYERMGDYPKAKKYAQLVLKSTQDDPTSHNYGLSLSNIGDMHIYMGEYDSAMFYFLEALEIATNNEDGYSKAAAYYQIAQIQLELSELEAAKKTISLAIEYYKTEKIKTEYLARL